MLCYLMRWIAKASGEFLKLVGQNGDKSPFEFTAAESLSESNVTIGSTFFSVAHDMF